MRRYLSIYLPTWAIDRLYCQTKPGLPPRDKPFVLFAAAERQQLIVTVNTAAARVRIEPGMSLPHARAILPSLTALPAEPTGDVAALEQMGFLLHRFTPQVALDGLDGLLLDITGCDHLWGGEEAMRTRIASTLTACGAASRLAIADTAGAAWGVARFGKDAIVPKGAVKETLAPLPVAALRLPHALQHALRPLGFTTIGDLYGMPRSSLTRRFGVDLTARLEQALGEAPAALTFLPEPQPLRRTLSFLEPLSRPEDLRQSLVDGLALIMGDLERDQLGARQVTAAFGRVDGQWQTVTVGTSRPHRNQQHLERLFAEKLETVDPGLGIERLIISVPIVERLLPQQSEGLANPERSKANVIPSDLVDRLTNRLGPAAVYGLIPKNSHIPERAVARGNPLVSHGHAWAHPWPRPLRLLAPPEPIATMALLPDYPPVQFTWRHVQHRVKAADGPERLAGEWWRPQPQAAEVRDYYRLENESGERYWVFRRTLADNDTRWYMHGIFA